MTKTDERGSNASSTSGREQGWIGLAVGARAEEEERETLVGARTRTRTRTRANVAATLVVGACAALATVGARVAIGVEKGSVRGGGGGLSSSVASLGGVDAAAARRRARRGEVLLLLLLLLLLLDRRVSTRMTKITKNPEK